MEKNGIFYYPYVSRMARVLNEAIKVQTNHAGKFERSEQWSRNFDECVVCGTTEIRHKGRGLCILCYNQDIEEKQKNSQERKWGIAGNKLSKEYLLREYEIKKKSLSDIAKECNCSRQFVYTKIKQYQIPTRTSSSARKIALEKGKVQFERIGEDGQSEFATLEKISLNENFFSSWSNKMAYVLGVIFTDGNIYSGGNDRHLSISQKEPELLNKNINGL